MLVGGSRCVCGGYRRSMEAGRHHLPPAFDEHVSRRFIDPGQYARAESLIGPAPALIAEELDLPAWVVEAWQRWVRHRSLTI